MTITDGGLAAFTSASTTGRRAQADAARMLGPDAALTLDQWLGLDAAIRGQDAKEAPRCLKRRLSDLVYHQLVLDRHGHNQHAF